MQEIWKPIPGHEGYEASNMGRVRSVDRIVMVPRRQRGKIMRQFTGEKGYMRVNIGRRNASIHHLVLEAFGASRPHQSLCRHLDGNPGNNCIDNLSWGSQSENMADAFRHGTFALGEKHSKAKLTKQDVISIRERVRVGDKTTDISKELGVSQAAVHAAATGKSWKSVKSETYKPKRKKPLKDKEVVEIRKLLGSGESLSAIGRRFGVLAGSIAQIRDGRSYRHVNPS